MIAGLITLTIMLIGYRLVGGRLATRDHEPRSPTSDAILVTLAVTQVATLALKPAFVAYLEGQTNTHANQLLGFGAVVMLFVLVVAPHRPFVRGALGIAGIASAVITALLQAENGAQQAAFYLIAVAVVGPTVWILHVVFAQR